jgi:hypothetical protein
MAVATLVRGDSERLLRFIAEAGSDQRLVVERERQTTAGSS